MPCPHNEITIVQRSQRQSAVAAAAYQSGEKLFCEYALAVHAGQLNDGFPCVQRRGGVRRGQAKFSGSATSQAQSAVEPTYHIRPFHAKKRRPSEGTAHCGYASCQSAATAWAP